MTQQANAQQVNPVPPELPPTQRDPTDDNFPTGPEVGSVLPDFTLTDQYGRTVNFQESRGGRRSLVLFHRSVRW